MMPEDYLISYGPLGLWTLSLLYERYRANTQTKKLIENNTEALVKVYECLSKIERRT